MTVAADRRLRTNKPLIGNGLQITNAAAVAAATAVVAGQYLYNVNTTAAARTMTLPTVPGDGEEHRFVRAAGTNNIVLDGNGTNINGSATLTLGAQVKACTIRYDATAGQWLEQGGGSLAAGAPAATAAANTIFAGPASGADAAPGFRAQVVADLPLNVVKKYKAAGRNGAGALTATGAKVGDKVIEVIGVVTATGAVVDTLDSSADFEATVTVADQIQQSAAGDKSANTYRFLVQPRS